MKKRGLASLFIVAIIAIAAVVGVIFAFQNSGRQKDAYAGITVSVDNDDIQLEIEIEEDKNKDKGFRILETPYSSAYFTITVGGIAPGNDHRVFLQKNSISNGSVFVESVTDAKTAAETGINKFKVTGQNCDAPVVLTFVTVGSQTVSVKVTVNMVAKDMKLGANAHFGVRQGGAPVNLSELDSKYVFYAHPADTEREFKPNKWSIDYRLKENYDGVILEDGLLTVAENSPYAYQQIYLQAKLPDMNNWIDVPFYVFPKADQILINPGTAYRPTSLDSEEKIWDLIHNRGEKSSANFSFALNCQKNSEFDYGFKVDVADTTMASREYVDQYTRKLATVQNLGVVAVHVTGYPIVNGVNFSDPSDKAVQISDVFYLRIRNEFYGDGDYADGEESFNLVPSKQTLDAFAYEGVKGNYYDEFTLNTGNGSPVNMDADVEFELIVDDHDDGSYTGTYTKSSGPQGLNLYSLMRICYWSGTEATGQWVELDSDNYYVNYLNKFSVSFTNNGCADDFLTGNKSLTLRIKSVNELSTSNYNTNELKYATCDIDLDVTVAIDQFKVDNLTEFEDGTFGVALVYNTRTQKFNSPYVDVYGMIAHTDNNNTNYSYSERWNRNKVVYNSTELPFRINCSEVAFKVNNNAGYKHLRYTFDTTAYDVDFEYYTNYPMTIRYANGVEYTFNVRVYPTVESLSMSVVGSDDRGNSSNGKIFRTITNKVSSYEYVQTVYVLKGYKYSIAVDTYGVSVGAYATFDSINNEAVNTRIFDATNLTEGLYTCTVTLGAYSQSVYQGHEQANLDNNTVYFIVVDPVGNVPLPLDVNLNGIGDSAVVTLQMSDLNGQSIVNNNFLHIEPVLRENKNILIEEIAKAKYLITAKYLTDDVFKVGFKIYKRYEFDLDDDGQVDESFEFPYAAGTPVDVNVKISVENANSIKTLTGNNLFNDEKLGNYLKLISSSSWEEERKSEVVIETASDADNEELGIAYAEWENGRFELASFAPVANGNDLSIGNVATATIDNKKVTILPVYNKTSLGNYALIIYARDSLRYVETKNNEELVLPNTYQLVRLYIGNAAEIETNIEEAKSTNHHDANSGVQNERGGYNWIIPEADMNYKVATLFYTPGFDETETKANVYYFDDLYTVLGWDFFERVFNNTTSDLFKIEKYVDGTNVGTKSFYLDGSHGRLVLNLNEFYTNNHDDEKMCSLNGEPVYFKLQVGDNEFSSDVVYFYVVETISNFDVVVPAGANGGEVLAVRKTLSANRGSVNDVYEIIVQRGHGFNFSTKLNTNAGWQLNSDDFSADRDRTQFITYTGGTYSLFPYIQFDYQGTLLTFNADALTTKVKVNVSGGIDYLNIVQNNSLNGVATATYDVVVRTDQETWRPNLLTYDFEYEHVYYSLFGDGNTSVAYVPLAGGKAKLEFRLSCLNVDSAIKDNSYFNYYLRIKVAVVIVVPDINPFFEIPNATLHVRENIPEDSPFKNSKTPREDAASFSLLKSTLDNVTLTHFAGTNVVENNRSALTLTSGQTDSKVIYLDEDVAGGLLVVRPNPNYINVTSMSLSTVEPRVEKVQIGKDLKGNPIYKDVNYWISFTQMIYNETAKCYQPYLSGSSTPKMVSTWSAAEGYKWTGEYYFKTNIETDSHISHRLTDGTSFVIKVSILGENNPKSISATMSISARYRDGLTITPETDAQDYAVRTMLQKQYQAIGTTAVYDIAMPTDCVPNYANFTVNGISTTTTTIQSTYATVTINPVTQTVTVVLNADAKAIDKTIEIRIPYRRPGDYVNPYLSVQITPVYFEFDDLEVIGHYESTIHLSSDNDKTQLNYRALFKYNTNMASESLNNKMKTFNNSLKNSNLLKFNYETPGEITVQIPYTYVNGVPVISQNGDGRYIHTFYYDVQQAVLERTEYLAVGTTATYTFYNWDALAVSAGLYLQNSNSAVDSFWSKDLKIQKNNTVLITVSLENKSSETDKNAYDALVRNGKITINLYSALNSNAAQLSLNIIPVYFTFDEFKLQNNPVRPLVALTTPTKVTVAASGIGASNYIAEKTDKIDVFNNALLNAQNDTSSNAALSFSRIPNDDGILNFNFDPETRNITRADKDEPVTAISYLLVTACIIYEDGVPKLSNSGNKISTYIPVQTFGENTNGNGSEIPGLELAPNGRTRTVAQTINTRIRYDVSLPNIIYDSRLDKSEITSSGTEEWTGNMGWDALISVKENKITVVLEDSAELFNRILSIKAYSQEGELVYILNIIPAGFTVEQIILADHIDESPVMIRANDDNWLQNLNLDFVDVRGSSNFDYSTAINTFRTSLNEGLVSRIGDSGYITLLAGINYVNGIPVLDNLVNGAITVKNVYRYEIVDGIPENTKAQAVGTEVIYNVNRDNFYIKVYNQNNGSWEYSNSNSICSVETCGSNQPRCIKVNLENSINLIGQRIRIGIFDMNNNGSEPEYILNIIPSYFTVDDLTAKGQNSEDRNLIFYYGENPSSPRNVVFDAIIGAYSSDYDFVSNNQIADKINEFITDLQGDKASLITRIFDSSVFSGDFHVTAYLKYIDGVPTLVQSDDMSGFVTRLDIDFVFAIYQRNDLDGNILPLPTGPRTRSEVQAIGTKTSYTIDLGKSLSVDTSLFDDTEASNRGWKANFVDNVLTIDLQPAIGLTPEETKDRVTQLLAEDLVFKFYSGPKLVFVLTVQPVLFEIVGIETVFTNQPVYLNGNPLEIDYRVVAKYNDEVYVKGANNAPVNIGDYINAFNGQLNEAKGDLFEIETVDDQYLKLDISVDYGTVGSDCRLTPRLLNVKNNPLNVVESYVEYVTTGPATTFATHYQAIGTTEYYNCDNTYGGIDRVNSNKVDASVVTLDGKNVLKVTLDADTTLIDQQIEITFVNGFVMIIKPVWYVVEGFEVVNHPERHMWLISTESGKEKIAELLFRARARYAMDATPGVLAEIQSKLNTFNQNLAIYEDDQWYASTWSNYLDISVDGAQYLIVRAAVEYNNGEARILDNIDEADQTKLVRDVFEYARYLDSGIVNGIAYPNVPRSRTVEVTIGYSAVYTIDVPDLSGFNMDMVALYESPDAKHAEEDNLTPYDSNNAKWHVYVVDGNKLYVELKPDLELRNKELKVFVYYNRMHVSDAPNSLDADNVAFILTIRPVLFKVTDFAIQGYNDDIIYTDNLENFTMQVNFVPVYEYANDNLNGEVEPGKTLSGLLNEFTNNFNSSRYISKTRIKGNTTESGVYYFQITTSVGYQAYQGVPYLTDETENRIWKTFKVMVTNDTPSTVREEYQAIGTTKTYYFDDLPDDLDLMFPENGTSYIVATDANDSRYYTITEISKAYTANWIKGTNYITVSLNGSAVISDDGCIDFVIANNNTLRIKPVYFEILGFELVEHPERPVWVIESSYSVNDLQYRVITSDLTNLPVTAKDNVNSYINNLNIKLNNGEAKKEISIEDNQYIVLDVAVDYQGGFPVFAEITHDKRNVVESIIKYSLWSSSKMPDPKQPTVMGKTQSNQVIGKTKLYTLKNVKGQVFYQYIWVENAGSLLTPFESSANGTVAVYEKLTIKVDPAKNTLQVQLSPDDQLLSNTVRVYVPYLTTVNGREIWYSHCIEITPLLFELKGWTIEAYYDNAKLISDASHNDYLLMRSDCQAVVRIKFVARINKCDDIKLRIRIDEAKNQLENLVSQFIIISSNSSAYNVGIDVGVDESYLKRYCLGDDKTDNFIGLSTYIVYEAGVPTLVAVSDNLVFNEILISTGYTESEWENAEKKPITAKAEYTVQAIGTSSNYLVEIPNAAKIFYDDIKAFEQGTERPISIIGERSNLVVASVADKYGDNKFDLTVELAPVVALRNYMIEIRIPYADDAEATKPNYYSKYYITPVVFVVDGFYLAKNVNNSLALTDKDVAFDLRVKASCSDDPNIRNIVNIYKTSFESALNNDIYNGVLKFNVINPEGVINADLISINNKLWIHKKSDADAKNYVVGNIKVGYANGGIPKVGGVNPLTDELIELQIVVTTQKGETSYFPGWDNITTEGKGAQYLQSIGTSHDYTLDLGDDLNTVFYYEKIKAFNGGSESGENKYECFDYVITNEGRQHLTLGLTLRAKASDLNDYIDVRIPYTKIVDGGTVWSYYSLQVKPVLFEIRGWKLKDKQGVAVGSITLDDSAIELCFTPDAVVASEGKNCYLDDEWKYIQSALNRLETEINTYDSRISDGYYYLVLENTPEPGHQINYAIYRDNSTNTSYLRRNIGESSTTVLTVSANIAYGVNNFNKEYVDGAHAVTSYSNSSGAQRVTSDINIYTTDKSISSINDHTTTFITQDTASRLLSLNSGVDYVLMSDIYLSNITELNEGLWKPVAFPKNATLDGNNYKIYIEGFDLSDKPNDIGLFTVIPDGSVVKNLQIVVNSDKTVDSQVSILNVDLKDYAGGAVNVGLVAGTNNGIVTNCAILSEWQFKLNELTNIVNPTTGHKFSKDLPFNKDGYLFDDNYFYELGKNTDGEIVVTRVYNNLGYWVTKNDATQQWDQVYYDVYHNVSKWISPDRTSVAKYENYSPIIYNEEEGNSYKSVSPAKLYVYANNKQLSVTLGGLIGSNTHIITNSRVLIDVELWGPEARTETGAMDEISVKSSIVGGVVGLNTGIITSSYFRDANVINDANADTINGQSSMLGGFVGQNSDKGKIQQSYAMGRSTEREKNFNFISKAGTVKSIRNSLGGFVHANSGEITDCLVNMVILETGKSKAGGFVYQNTSKGKIQNCIENNYFITGGNTSQYYSAFVHQNGDVADTISTTSNLKNIIYAGIAAENTDIDSNLTSVVKRLSNNIDSARYSDVRNYEGFSIGMDDDSWEISSKNTIWKMTEVGPMLRAANDIAVSFRKFTWNSSPYLYNPGTAENPYLIWNEDQFNDYIYTATAEATAADADSSKPLTDIENNRQGNHIRLIDNIKLTSGIKDTYKIIYTGTMEGNGLTMSEINLPTVTNDLATMGLFGKTEYATIRNINFEFGSIDSEARYVGGIAGIAINTSFVDVNVSQGKTGKIVGANIVGGFVGLNVITDSNVENYNLTSSAAVTANFNLNERIDNGAQFGSGVEYCRQTLYARVNSKKLNIHYDQGFGAAGGVFGFVTSNPNNYRVVDGNGNETIHARRFTKLVELKAGDGTPIGSDSLSSYNMEASWFLKDRMGNDISESKPNKYFYDTITLRNIRGNSLNISGSVAGGLIGIMDETIELAKPYIANNGLSSLVGKYYLGGLVGINLGKISGETVYSEENGSPIPEQTYSAMTLSSWPVASSVGGKNNNVGSYYAFSDDTSAHIWGMTVGAIAGSNDGIADNHNSGVIENIKVSVNVLSGSNVTRQYIIGGVVGANGDFGFINNAFNTNFTNNAQIQTQSTNVGYYFGRIVGRSSTVNTPFSSSNNTSRMICLQVDYPNSSVTATNFTKTTNGTDIEYRKQIISSFNLGTNTPKVQTMTFEEYKIYLSQALTRSGITLVERLQLLEPWVLSLPTSIEPISKNGVNASPYVAKYDVTAKNDLLRWVSDETHKVFNEHELHNFEKYLEYYAIGEHETKFQDMEDFKNNVKTLHNKRYEMAQDIFLYQGKTSTGIAGNYNSTFKWEQYEDYLTFRDALTSEILTLKTTLDNFKKDFPKTHSGASMTETDYEQAFIDFAKDYASDTSDRTKYSDSLADMIYPNGLFAEFQKKTVSTAIVSETINLSHNLDYAKMFLEYSDAKRYTNKDPLQVYVSYVTQKAAYPDAFRFSNGGTLSLAQYYYFMNRLYGVYEDFSAVKINDNTTGNTTVTPNYVLYVGMNNLLNESGNILTIQEFIDMIKNEAPIVIANETNWIKTGHLGGGGVRISSVGAVELEWVSTGTSNWQSSVIVESDGLIHYGNETTIVNGATVYSKQWNSYVEYSNACQSLGLTIQKYREIIGMGGSLHQLINKYTDDGQGATDKYIFALKAEQYNWTQEQQTFIQTYYKNENNNYDFQYALAATTYGNVLSYTGSGSNGNIRAVYKSNAQEMNKEANSWYADGNGDGSQTVGEVYGVLKLRGSVGSIFKNGDGKEYHMNKSSICLYEDKLSYLGAAMYLDVDGNKMFGVASGPGDAATYEAGKDVLMVYEVSSSNGADFYTGEGTDRKYYKIIRQILQINDLKNTNVDEPGTEASGNFSDYLEEALWWRAEGFTAAQFSAIKNHAMTESIKDGFVESNSNYTTRAAGYTLADDWDYNGSGFKNYGGNDSKFTPAEYTEIVLGAKYDNGIWYSTFADYKLFVTLYNASKNETTEINSAKIKEDIPNTSKFKNPFGSIGADVKSRTFLVKLADENLLADAIDFDSDREAFLTLFRAGHSTAEYITWAENFNFNNLNDEGTNDEKYFRLNHYIYWVKNALENEVKIGRQDEDDKYLNPEDFSWVLKQSVRDDIFYEGVTEESRTTDLVEYRLNWFDKAGNAFMTYRDYCEWINIYAYNDEYKIDRGDLGKEIGDLAGSLGIEGDENNNEQLNSTDGWLTIEAFAVWKRMEKYENNIEYLNKIGTTSGQEAITAPILKRQISTTVFPKIYNSGEQSPNFAGAATGNHVLKTPGGNAHDYYGWGPNTTMDENHARPFKDVYEYNERYEEREITRIINSDNQNQQHFFVATRLIDDLKFSAECDQNCGGLYSCQNPNHAAYQVKQWINRYDGRQGSECVGPNDYNVWLKLDEKQLEGLKPAAVDGKYYYRQLYVPFDYFKRACQMIKVRYQSTNYRGYHNYMKYWARNGAWNWICNQSEYSGNLDASLFVKVDKTYMVTSFWNNYDGTKSPIDGHEGLNGANVDGKGGAKAYGDFGQQN